MFDGAPTHERMGDAKIYRVERRFTVRYLACWKYLNELRHKCEIICTKDGIWLKISAAVLKVRSPEMRWGKRKHMDFCIKLLKIILLPLALSDTFDHNFSLSQIFPFSLSIYLRHKSMSITLWWTKQ